MAKLAQTYRFLGQSILNPCRFVPVVPFGVEILANGDPSVEKGDWFRLDLVLRVRPPSDSDFVVRLVEEVGTVMSFLCPQQRNEPLSQSAAITVTSEDGTGRYAGKLIGRLSAPRTPNRIVKIADRGGVYLVRHDGRTLFPPLNAPASAENVVHADGAAALTYAGVLSDETDLTAVAGASERLDAYRLRFYESR